MTRKKGRTMTEISSRSFEKYVRNYTPEENRRRRKLNIRLFFLLLMVTLMLILPDEQGKICYN